MIQEQGVVRQVEGAYAEVVVQRGSSSCGESCPSGGCGCGANLFGDSNPAVKVRAKNVAGAHERDIVVLSISDGAFFKGSAIAYLFPVALLVTGGILGPRLAGLIGWSLSGDAASALFAALFFILSFVIVGLYSRSQGGSEQYVPEIVEIVGKAPVPQPGMACHPDANPAPQH